MNPIDITAALRALYGLTGTLLLLGYVPQTLAVWKSTNGARDVSLPTWILWLVSGCVTTAYAFLVARDMSYFLVAAGNALGCAAVVGLVVLRRWRYEPQSHRRLRNAGREMTG